MIFTEDECLQRFLLLDKWRTPVSELTIDRNPNPDILTVEEAALYLRKSPSWVYKNWQVLGGRKLGGSLFFPRKEELYERLFGKGQGVGGTTSPRRGSGTRKPGSKPKKRRQEPKQEERRS